MNTISKKFLMNMLSKILILVIIAKVVALIALYFLPSNGVNKKQQKSFAPSYARYNFKAVITQEKVAKQVAPVVKKSDNAQLAEISSLILKGLYHSSKSSFVFIAKKSQKNKIKMLRINESFQGYKLIRIEGNSAVFSAHGKEYVLKFEKVDKSKLSKNKIIQAPSKSHKEIKSQVAATVGRSEIQYYAKHFKQIWRDIAIAPVKKGKKITGFKVTRIKANTPFAKLGLKTGDIIIRANNIDMTSYRDALKIYEKVDELTAVDIVVLRNNQELELEYEIY